MNTPELVKRLERVEASIRAIEATVGLCAVACVADVMGYRIVQRVQIVKGHRYTKWYAVKRTAGKERKIYIGNDPSKAAEKIRAWLAKHEPVEQGEVI